MISNLAIICDIINNSPVGIICFNPKTGDIAYATEDKNLSFALENILDNKNSLDKNERINNFSMMINDSIDINDSYYLISINYELPLPWRILGVKEVEGDIEEIVDEAFISLKGGIQ